MGVGTTRELDRIASAVGQLQEAAPQFLHANNVCNAGVLFLIPALLSQGLLKVFAILEPLRKGYYGLLSILLVLAFMLLSRIKCPEQLKTCKVGELGKLLGLDRVPEAKCLRSKIDQIVSQRKSDELIRALSQEWIDKDDALFFYIDGHVQVYHGYQATLPKRYVSREKLCLAGTTEFWVNDELGMPYMVVTGELNEKLKTIILEQIVPALMRQTQGRVSQEQLDKDPTLARFALVFDREAYDLSFFKQLWDGFRIAVLTYRKAVKDSWPVSDFSDYTTTVIAKSVVMKLCEKPWEHHGCVMREIRKLSENGHQTSIVSTLLQASTETLAGKMLSRWSQENFFRYMVQDYDLDKMIQYGVEEVNPEKEIVNPSYKNLSYRIKKEREKLARLKAKLFTKIEDDLGDDIDGVKQQMQQQSKLQESISNHECTIEELRAERETIPYYLKVKDMPADTRYNKLKTESKLFMNTIRMITYRAETAIVNLIAPTYSRSAEEGRMLVKEIIKSDADMIPDYENKTLTLRLHSLSTPRANNAAKDLCALLNETETVFPGSELRLVYQTV
jgi:hypothetical protein